MIISRQISEIYTTPTNIHITIKHKTTTKTTPDKKPGRREVFYSPLLYLCKINQTYQRQPPLQTKLSKNTNMDEITEEIKNLEEQISKNPANDTLHYRLGNAYRKTGNWKEAIKSYIAATEINPASPAAEAYKSIMDILEFYNKDMYNP